jgi:hypothetical protein
MQNFRKEYEQLKGWFSRIAALPGKDYPPANLAKCIRICEEVNRKDLAEQIMQGWNKAFDKHAAAILKSRSENGAWAAATVIGQNSVKKNVFGGKEFGLWLEAQKSGTAPAPSPKTLSEAKKIDVTEPPKGVPAIALPKPNETTEDWSAQAEKTKQYLNQIKEGLADNAKFVEVMEREMEEIKRKIADYGPGGAKAVTKGGKPHKFTERVKKWEVELTVYETKIAETKAGLEAVAKKFNVAEANYKTNPACTVEYEKQAQESLEGVLEVLLNMKDKKKQKEMLGKFNDMFKDMQSGDKAASMDREAGFWDTMTDAVDSVVSFLTSAWKALTAWIKSLFVSVDKFDHIATDVGRY